VSVLTDIQLKGVSRMSQAAVVIDLDSVRRRRQAEQQNSQPSAPRAVAPIWVAMPVWYCWVPAWPLR
jgi:hypothetical protein